MFERRGSGETRWLFLAPSDSRWYANNTEAKDARKASGWAYHPAAVAGELLQLLLTGAAGSALAQFFAHNLNEAGLVKLARTTDSACAEVQQLLGDQVAAAAELLLLRATSEPFLGLPTGNLGASIGPPPGHVWAHIWYLKGKI